MAVNMSIKAMRRLCLRHWCQLSNEEKLSVRKSERVQIGQFCKYGYTQYSLWDTCKGLIFCNSYSEYVEIMHSEDD